jgi:hypothetical protein
MAGIEMSGKAVLRRIVPCLLIFAGLSAGADAKAAEEVKGSSC